MHALTSIPTADWRSKLRLWAAALVILVILTDLVLQITGLTVLCKSCGQQTLHRILLSAGLIGWGAFLLTQFLSAGYPRWRVPAGALLAILIGVHLGLLSRVVLMPEPCLTCLTCGSLAGLLLTTFPDQHLPTPASAIALLGGLGFSNLLLAL